MTRKAANTADESAISHSHDAVKGGLHCAFSVKKQAKIGTGTTTRRTTTKVFWYAEQLSADEFAIWMLNKNSVPTGAREIISKQKLLENFHPEIEHYAETVRPSIAKVGAHVVRGERHRQKKEFKEAAQEFRSALQIDEENVRALFGLGLAYLQNKDIEKAQQVFPQLLDLEEAFEPEHKHLFNELGIELRKNEMFDEAVRYYDRAVALSSQEDENLRFNLARAHYEMNDWHGCLENLAPCMARAAGVPEVQSFARLVVGLLASEELCERYAKPSPRARLSSDGWELAKRVAAMLPPEMRPESLAKQGSAPASGQAAETGASGAEATDKAGGKGKDAPKGSGQRWEFNL